MFLGEQILGQLEGMSVYSSIRHIKLIKKFRKLFDPENTFSTAAKAYGTICNLLYESDSHGSLPDYLMDQILCDENKFTVFCANHQFAQLPLVIRQAAASDLTALDRLSQITSRQLKEFLSQRFPEKQDVIFSWGDYSNERQLSASYGHWGECLNQFVQFHEKNGISIFTKYYAFYFSEEQQVVPVKQFEPVHLSSLKKYETQKKQIVDNTLSFLHCKPANNVLLYGDRGTGKSTAVNAILTEYHSQGLRMIQIAKEDILHINCILETVRHVPLRFILFIDDLTFEENDECFNILKAVLEGSLNAMPENVLIYATTNRRHLIKETFSSREGNELHASDTRDENASLADRFGLTVTFTKPNLSDFLEIVCEIARERGLDIDTDVLCRGANIFAMKKASRSGRVARQYVDDLEGRLSLGLPLP